MTDRQAGRSADADNVRHYNHERRNVAYNGTSEYRRPASRGDGYGSRRPQPRYDRTGAARWMGKSWLGHNTVTGEVFDPDRLTGAHATLPLPSFVYVTNRANGRTVLIRVNDRVPPSPDRTIVVSRKVADLLDFSKVGRADVVVQYAGPAGREPRMHHEAAFLERQPWFRSYSNSAQREATSQGRDGTRRYARPSYPRWDNTQRY